ncbi:MAG: response regulator [Planctomycetota bacterium]
MNRTLRILVADDIDPVRSLLTIFAERLEIDCDAVATGSAAVEAFLGRRYDVVLLDCMMPGMSGYEAARLMRDFEQREQVHRTPIVAISSAPDEDLCRNAGMDGWGPKPSNAQELKTLLERYLGSA